MNVFINLYCLTSLKTSLNLLWCHGFSSGILLCKLVFALSAYKWAIAVSVHHPAVGLKSYRSGKFLLKVTDYCLKVMDQDNFQEESLFNQLALPTELLVYIFSFLSSIRDRIKLRYVSSWLRCVIEGTPSIWKEFVWPYYDSREECSMKEVLKVCGSVYFSATNNPYSQNWKKIGASRVHIGIRTIEIRQFQFPINYIVSGKNNLKI